ncbi:hypothetical protein V1525DRAFT_400769 [Lipomyces kononenkoae]|uniref:Uncharacterized protein n=1 Tax=Lipomyces kononenkoae TaxID=34357 RepID=A0ACC3T6Q3_LIPKO
MALPNHYFKTGTRNDDDNDNDNEDDYGFDDDVDEHELQLLEENARKFSQAAAVVRSSRSRTESVRVPHDTLSTQVVEFLTADEDGDEQAMSELVSRNADLNEWSQQQLQEAKSSSSDVDSLVLQIHHLQKQNAELQQARDDAANSLQTARGEISIIRSHMTSISSSHDQAIVHLKSVQDTERQRHESEITELRREVDRLQAERAFMERDLKELMDKMRTMARTAQREAQAAASSELRGSPSPRKPKRPDRSSGLRDGFDVPVSPTKYGRKRRRPELADVDENMNVVLRESTNTESLSSRDSSSAGPVLFVHGSDSMLTTPNENIIIREKEKAAEKIRMLYEFVTKLYNCQLEPSGANIFDILSNYSVELKHDDGPTEYSGSLSAAITGLVNMHQSGTIEVLIESLILRVMELWHSQVTDTTTTSAIDPLLGILKFIVTYDPNLISLTMLQGVVVACQETFVRLESRTILHSTDRQAMIQLAVLSLFDSIVQVIDDRQGNYTQHNNRINGLWQSVSVEFILRILANTHVTPRLSIRFHEFVSRILTASILPGSFGAVLQTQEEQSSAEGHIIDQLTRLLIDDPVGFAIVRVEAAENLQHPDYDEYEYELELVSSRMQIVNTLRALSTTTHGERLLAEHPKVTARLICSISQQLDRVYETDFVHNSADRTELISLVVRLLHRMHFGTETPTDDGRPVSTIANNPNILNPYGAKYELIVGLTRVAFGEGMLYHNAFDDTTVDCARNLLQIGRTIQETNLLYASMNAE